MVDGGVIYLNLDGSEGTELPAFALNGIEAEEAQDSDVAMRMALTGRYKAIVLDVGTDPTAALIFLSRLRERSRIPVLVLISKSAVDALPDIYAAGADGHLWSPTPRVLLNAKLLAILRRSYLFSSASSTFQMRSSAA